MTSSLRICLIGIKIPMDGAEQIDLGQHRSLSDFDVIVFCPSFYFSSGRQYDGLAVVEFDDASRLHRHYEHWKSELTAATAQNKSIFILMCKPREYYFQTGGKDVSGTGRNARVTNHVQKSNTYACLRDTMSQPIAIEGRRLNPGKESARFPMLSKLLADRQRYEAVVEKAQNPLLQLPDQRVAGFVSRSHSNLLVVPNLTEIDDWIDERLDAKGNLTRKWSKAAIGLASQFKEALLEAHAAIRVGSGEAKPAWVLSEQYQSVARRQRTAVIEERRNEIEALRNEIAKNEADNAVDDLWLTLLFGTGSALEGQVRAALRLMGFKAEEYSDDTHQFDVVFEADGQRYIGECEGKDNKAVDIQKLSQLERCVAEDLAVRDADEFSPGVLFANGHRLHPLEDRPQAFTERVLKAAEQRRIRLVWTGDLFKVVLALTNGAPDTYAAACRAAIHDSAGGPVAFPEP